MSSEQLKQWDARSFCWDAHFNINEIFSKNDIHSVALYGAGRNASYLAERIRQKDSVAIKYVVDINPDVAFPYPVPIYQLENIPREESVDLVIITPLGLGNDFILYKKLQERTGSRVTFFQDIVIDANQYAWLCKANSHVASCGGVLLLLDFTDLLFNDKNAPNLSNIEKVFTGNIGWRSITSRFDIDNGFFKLFYGDLCDLGYSCEELKTSLFSLPRMYEYNSIKYIQDHKSRYLNVVNHKRVTTDCPDMCDASIHLFGNCNAVGCFAPDDMTIASQLQRRLNARHLHDKVFRVENQANWSDALNSAKQICTTSFMPGDIVLLLNRFRGIVNKFYCHGKGQARYFDVAPALQRPHEFGEVMLDCYHLTHRGYTLLAKYIHAILERINEPGAGESSDGEVCLSSNAHPLCSMRYPLTVNPEKPPADLEKYIQSLKEYQRTCSGISGSIVMNCNPFTNGHRYLIEQAASQCSVLYLFVVQEDKSHFDFATRFEMVKKGTAELRNVVVIPSGSFILSSQTLPEYFSKEEQANVKIDAAIDLILFGEQICRALNITKRFVGDEPTCNITNQYNREMLAILPKYGVEVIVIKRKKIDSLPISASLVRKMIQQGEYSAIKKLVPQTTYEILQRIYGAL